MPKEISPSGGWRQEAAILEFPNPRIPEGVFLDGANFEQDPDNPIREAFGTIQVGDGETYYKGYFPENRTQSGLGVIVSGYGGFLKSSACKNNFSFYFYCCSLLVLYPPRKSAA